MLYRRITTVDLLVIQNISASGNWDNNYMFQHLYVSEKLILDFICVFSRLEYALKVSGFARGDSKKLSHVGIVLLKKLMIIF